MESIDVELNTRMRQAASQQQSTSPAIARRTHSLFPRLTHSYAGTPHHGLYTSPRRETTLNRKVQSVERTMAVDKPSFVRERT